VKKLEKFCQCLQHVSKEEGPLLPFQLCSLQCLKISAILTISLWTISMLLNFSSLATRSSYIYERVLGLLHRFTFCMPCQTVFVSFLDCTYFAMSSQALWITFRLAKTNSKPTTRPVINPSLWLYLACCRSANFAKTLEGVTPSSITTLSILLGVGFGAC